MILVDLSGASIEQYMSVMKWLRANDIQWRWPESAHSTITTKMYLLETDAVAMRLAFGMSVSCE